MCPVWSELRNLVYDAARLEAPALLFELWAGVEGRPPDRGGFGGSSPPQKQYEFSNTKLFSVHLKLSRKLSRRSDTNLSSPRLSAVHDLTPLLVRVFPLLLLPAGVTDDATDDVKHIRAFDHPRGLFTATLNRVIIVGLRRL